MVHHNTVAMLETVGNGVLLRMIRDGMTDCDDDEDRDESVSNPNEKLCVFRGGVYAKRLEC